MSGFIVRSGHLNEKGQFITGPDDTALLRRAVTNARSREYQKGRKHPRWVAVMDVFALGSTYAAELCARFDLDPDEMVKR